MAKKTVKRNNHHLSFNIWLKTRELHALDDAYDAIIKDYSSDLIIYGENAAKVENTKAHIGAARANYLSERTRIKAEIKAEQAKQEVIEAGGEMLTSATAITIDT